MKTIVATLLLSAALAAPASAANMCVKVRDILSTHSDDGKLLTFKLRGGRTLVNHLQGICTDLRYEGLAWNVPSSEDVCENQQSFRVINSGQSCTLGKFDEVKEKPKTP